MILLSFLLLFSRTSKKQEALNRLENLTADVEKNGGSWSEEQWIGSLEGRCVSAMANHLSGGKLKKLKDFGTELGGSLKGLLEGIGNSSASDD